MWKPTLHSSISRGRIAPTIGGWSLNEWFDANLSQAVFQRERFTFPGGRGWISRGVGGGRGNFFPRVHSNDALFGGRSGPTVDAPTKLGTIEYAFVSFAGPWGTSTSGGAAMADRLPRIYHFRDVRSSYTRLFHELIGAKSFEICIRGIFLSSSFWNFFFTEWLKSGSLTKTYPNALTNCVKNKNMTIYVTIS